MIIAKNIVPNPTILPPLRVRRPRRISRDRNDDGGFPPKTFGQLVGRQRQRRDEQKNAKPTGKERNAKTRAGKRRAPARAMLKGSRQP